MKDLATLDTIEDHDARLNVGRCDRLGRLWCGMTGPQFRPNEKPESVGALYSFAAGQCRNWS